MSKRLNAAQRGVVLRKIWAPRWFGGDLVNPRDTEIMEKVLALGRVRKEVAAEHGISVERIKQIECKMKARMFDAGLSLPDLNRHLRQVRIRNECN
jgi:DNA-directed RNA polymerase sigma subunit (sigma70/sigma32)